MVTNPHPTEQLTGDSASQRDLPYIDLVDAQGNVQRSLALGERGVTIGSAPGNLLVLEGPSVARSHVRIDWDGQNAAVQNLATRRPTLYEGASLQANDLRVWQPGEQLQVGDYRLKLRLGGAGSASEPSSASQVTTPLSAIAASGLDANSSLDLRLDNGYDLLELTPDQMVAVKLTLTNRGTTPETVMLSVDGPAAAWVRLPPTPVQIRPVGSTPLMLPVTVLRKPENRAGEYEVVIRARGQSNPANSASAIGRWTVLPFSDARVELRPPTLKLRGTNSALYTVALRNLGNVSMPFELRMTDDQQQLEFAPNLSSGVIEPGATDERKVEVLPLRQPDDKEQTYNVRLQATANGQTYTDSSTLIQRRGGMPPWAVWLLAALFGLALLAIPTLFLAYRANAQNNANGTQVAMMQQTRDSMLTFDQRTGTASSSGTQTVVAQTLQAVSAGVANAPTATVLSQINATAIAGAAQLTAQAALIASTQAKPGGSNTTNNNFFGDGANGSPGQATMGALLQALQAASGQVSGSQTSQAAQSQAGTVAQTSAAQTGQTAAAQSNLTAQANATTSANTQSTQAAQTSATNTANQQNTQVAQTAAVQTSSAAAAQTAAAQTAAAQTAAAQTAAAQQTQQAQAGQTSVVQTQQADQTHVAQTPTAAAQNATATQAAIVASQTASAVAATATAEFLAQASKLDISTIIPGSTVRANDPFDVDVVVLDRNNQVAATNGSNFLITIELQDLQGNTITVFPNKIPTDKGRAKVTGLQWQVAGSYRLVAKSGALTPSAGAALTIKAKPATAFAFRCFLANPDTACPASPPLAFTTPADQMFGFVGIAVDEFGNWDQTFSGSTYIKIDYDDKRPAEVLSNQLPPFSGGMLVFNRMDLPDNIIGERFFFEFGTTNIAIRGYTPEFTVIPGTPKLMSSVAPVPDWLNQSSQAVFKVIVKDKKQNPISSTIRVCFQTNSPRNNNFPDLAFIDQNAQTTFGRVGIWVNTDSSGYGTSFRANSNGRFGSYLLYAYVDPRGSCDLNLNVSVPPPSPMIYVDFFLTNVPNPTP